MDIKILAFADLKKWSPLWTSQIVSHKLDCCVLLGDVSGEVIREIKRLFTKKPIFGVLGDSDNKNVLVANGIPCLDDAPIRINGVTFAGISGTNRYRVGSEFCMLTQKESVDLAAQMPPCDILITHDAGAGTMNGLYKKARDKNLPESAYHGLKGINQYIEVNKPKAHLFGHYGVNINKTYLGCVQIGIHNCAIVSFPENITRLIGHD